MITEATLFISLGLSIVLLAFSVRLGISIYQTV